METKHTPAPWRVARQNPGPTTVVQANARLIAAAAPDLLAALKKLAADCDGDALGTTKAPRWAVLCAVETAIAKAEGRA